MNSQSIEFPATEEERQERLEEYKSLREETLKRIELGVQIINFNLVAAGALWTIGTTSSSNHQALLFYTALAFCFAMAYLSNVRFLAYVGPYIRENIEKPSAGLCWAIYYAHVIGKIKYFDSVAVVGLFVVPQVVSILLYCSNEQCSWNPTQNSYLVNASAVLTILTFVFAMVITSFVGEPSVKKRSEVKRNDI